MKKYLFITVFISLSISLVNMAFCYEITVVKSSSNKVNRQVQLAFIDQLEKRAPSYGLKSIQPHRMTEVVIANGEEAVNTAQQIRNIQPDLILALGAEALKVAISVPGIPIVYLLVIDPEKIIGNATRVTGVSLVVSPKVQLNEIKRYLPGVKRIGLVYDPKQSSTFIEQLDVIKTDLQIISLTADTAAEVPGLIHSLRGRVDLLWMLPDITTTNQITLQSYYQFSVKNETPLLTFSEKLLKSGATIAITFDIDAMVEQAADLAMLMLSRGDGEKPATIVAPRIKTVVNHTIAAKLNITVAGGEGTND